MFRFADRLSNLLGLIAELGFLLLATFISYEVAARYLFHAPTSWSEEAGRLVLVWSVFLGMPAVYSRSEMISMDLLLHALSARAKKLAAALCHLAVMLFSIILGYYGWLLAENSLEQGRRTTSMLQLPEAMFQLAIPIGFGLLAYFCLVEIAHIIVGAPTVGDKVEVSPEEARANSVSAERTPPAPHNG